jgi:hypothetical protein
LSTVAALETGRADVTVGEEVQFAAVVEAPPGTGTVVSAEWDFDGSGEYAVSSSVLDGSCILLSITAAHAFTEPGTRPTTPHRFGRTSTRTLRTANQEASG